MPIDPNIALSAQGVGPLVNPMDLMQQIEQSRIARQNADALEDQRRAIAEQRQQQTADRQAVGTAIQQGGGVRDATLAWATQHAPTAVPSLTEYFDKADERTATIKKLRNDLATHEADLFGSLADGALSHGATPEALRTALDYVTEQFPDYQPHADQIWAKASASDDATRKQILEQIRDLSPAYKASKPKNTPQVLSPGSALVDDAGKVLFTQPTKPPDAPNTGSFEDYVNRLAKEKGTTPDALSTKDIESARKAYQQADDRPRITVLPTTAGGTTDIKEAVAGMKDGTIPPQLPGRASKDYTAMLAEAHRQGYDLATAATDWVATQKHFSTLNGAQQTRIRQAVDTAYHSLDEIDRLAAKWKGGRFPLLNSVTLKGATSGLYGKEAAQTATALQAQISDLTSELGNVYMGGNSPTDHALSLAAQNLSANWSQDVLKTMTDLARRNLKIRQNAISNVRAVGVSGDNPYDVKATDKPADLVWDPKTGTFKKPGGG